MKETIINILKKHALRAAKAIVAAILPVLLVQLGVTDADTIEQIVSASVLSLGVYFTPNRD